MSFIAPATCIVYSEETKRLFVGMDNGTISVSGITSYHIFIIYYTTLIILPYNFFY